ncbi:MAG: hypothetical protein NC319_02160 [Butyricicoccus sp.]|nr:hypothetical protein [Butyricicoccus sp.]
MANETKRGIVRSKAYYINAVIGVVLMFGIGLLPPLEPITEMGMKVLGIFIGMVYLFSACDTHWPALLAICGLSIVGYCSLGTAAAGSLGHSVVFQSATAYIVAGALNYYGVTEHIARWILSRKALKGHPYLFIYVIYASLMLICIFTSSLAMIILYWAIFDGILKVLDYKKGDKFATSTIVGIALAFVVGGAIAPIRSWQLTLFNLWGDTVSPLSLMKFMAVSFPGAFASMALYLLYQVKILKADFKPIQEFDVTSLANAEQMDKRQRKLLWVAVVVFFFVFLSALLPKSFPLYDLIANKISAAGFFALGAAYVAMASVDGKESLIKFSDVAGHCIQWPVLLMIGSTMVVASAITNESTGIMEFISQMLGGVFAGKGSWFVLIVAMLITTILTNAASNIAIGTAMVPILAPFIQSTGSNAMAIGIMLIWLVNMGLILPGASAPVGLIHGNEDLTNREAYVYSCVGMLVILLATIPLAIIANICF